MMRNILLIAVLLLVALPARADWLDKAWSDAVVAKNGAPAVTLTDSGILLVLPEATLAEAHDAGVEAPQAVQLFVRRYAQHCSANLDLDAAHKGVKVSLFTLRPVPLEEASEHVQGEVLGALLSKGGRRVPHVRNLFVTDHTPREFVIDYEPARQVHCIAPGDPVS